MNTIIKNLLSRQTAVYELLNALNSNGVINDRLFFYFLDVLPSCLTWPREKYN